MNQRTLNSWSPNNSEQVIPREHINGTICGVDFGPNVYVIARSQTPMLLWLSGHSYSINGHQKYAESHLTLMICDRFRMGKWGNYRSLDPRGGRLSLARLMAAKTAICEVFGEDRWSGICHAVVARKTLIIEGGGETPQPSSKLGHDAYLRWRENVVLG